MLSHDLSQQPHKTITNANPPENLDDLQNIIISYKHQ